MNILFITYEFPPYFFGGGSGIYAKKIVEKFNESNINTYIIFANPNYKKLKVPKKIGKNIFLIPINIKRFIGLNYLLFNIYSYKIIKNLKKRFDIAHFNIPTLYSVPKIPNILSIHHPYISLIILLKIKPNLIFSPRFLMEFNPLLILIERIAINKCDKIITVSNFSKNWIKKYYKINENKLHVIFNGFNYSLPNKDDVVKLKNEYNLSNKKIILFIGRLEYRKGVMDLVKAVLRLKNKENLLCIIIGKGPLKNKILKIINKFNANDKFLFIDYVNINKLYSFYSLCDLYVQPSYLEGFGLTIIDAMAAGKPVISTRVGAIPEIIKHNYTGILINPGDINNLTNYIDYFLKNPEKLKILGENAKNYIYNKFSWDLSAKKIINIYRKILD